MDILAGQLLGPVIYFDDFRLDVARRALVRVSTGNALPITSRAIDALIYLISRSGALVTKAELLRAVWPDVTVEPNSLAQCIASIRKALDERPAKARFILTEPGRGYRFIAQTQITDAAQTKKVTPRRGRTSANPQAFQLYVSGWFAITRQGGSGLTGALEKFQRAAALDPDFALAHVCVAQGYALSGVFELARPHEVFPKAREALARGMAINPDLAEAHAVLGHIQLIYDLNFASAEDSLKRALSIDPHCAMALHYSGMLMIMLGRHDEALGFLRDAQTEEPLAANINANIAAAHYFAGYYHEAAAQAKAALELDQSFAHARSILGRSLLRIGQFDQAIEEFNRRTGPTVGGEADLPVALAMSGRTEAARAELLRLRTESSIRHVSPYAIAAISAALGDANDALTWLETAHEERAQYISYLACDPVFVSLRSAPRFLALLKSMRLAQPISSREPASD